MPHCHGVRIAEAKRARHQYQEQRILRIYLSRVTSFGGTRACVFTSSPTTPLDGTMQTPSATVKLVSTEVHLWNYEPTRMWVGVKFRPRKSKVMPWCITM